MKNSLSSFHACLSSPMQALGFEWWNPLPQPNMILEEDRFMDPDDSRDYADQFPYPDGPDSPGSINDENLEILASIMKLIPECINKADFDRLSDLLPHMEPVQVATRTVQEAIAVSYY